MLRGSADASTPAVRNDSTMTDTPILICYDGSPAADRAIASAAELLGPRRAVVLDIGPPITPAQSLATISAVVPSNSFEELNEDDARQGADRGAELARSSGFDAKARAAVVAPTWEGITEVADELDVPVIVIGSRGLSGLKETLEGSLSHEVARHAGRPVLIVPPPHDGQ
jgi:nucleotide-binding universal stress UspA family protein